MLKFEYLKPGQKIRAYDFEPVGDWRDELYVEGKILRHELKDESKFLVIECDCDSTNSEYFKLPSYVKQRGYRHPSRVGEEVFVPMEMCITEWDGRVTEIFEKLYISVKNEFGETVTKEIK